MVETYDVGLTHVALVVSDLNRSIPFYERFAAMQVVHRRRAPEGGVAWLSDLTRPFVIVLAQGPAREPGLGPFGHLGVACPSRAEVDRLAGQAAAEGILRKGPYDAGPPVGYWALIADPDGHTLELTFGQEVGLTVLAARSGPLENRERAPNPEGLDVELADSDLHGSNR